MTRLGYCVFAFEGGTWAEDNFEGLEQAFAHAARLDFDCVEVASYVRSDRPRRDLDFIYRMDRVLEMSERHRMPLSAIFASVSLLDPDLLDLELAELEIIARLAATSGASYLPVTVGMDHVTRSTAAAVELAGILTAAGERIARHGVRLDVHPHLDGPLEMPEQVEAFLDATDPRFVGLCLDVGHYAAGGGDPVDLARRRGDRIDYVHLKDLSRDAFATAAGGDRYRAFRDPGAGDLDIAGVMHELSLHGFDGPVLAENDFSPDPIASIETSAGYLRGLLRA